MKMESQTSSKGEHYNLRWNSYTNNLIQVFAEHQHHEILVDVTLICEGQYIKAHKLVLSACSGFFEEMFRVHGGVQHPFIILNGIKFSHLKHILEFIYHGEIKVLDVDLEGVLALGESFQVKGLSSVKLKHQISLQNEDKGIPLKNIGIMPSAAYTNVQRTVQNNGTVPQKENTGSTGISSSHSISYRSSMQNDHLKDNSNTIQNARNKLESKVCEISDSKEKTNHNIYDEKDMEQPEKKRIRTVSNDKGYSPVIKRKENLENTPTKENKIIDTDDKIPRPPNAFMIFTNEWRKKLTIEHPEENHKAISVKLGQMWKCLSAETKETYYLAAKKAQTDHQLKYPEYYQSPDTKRKAVRRKTIDAVPHVTSVESQEYNDDLEIIEIADDPIDVSDILQNPNSSSKL